MFENLQTSAGLAKYADGEGRNGRSPHVTDRALDNRHHTDSALEHFGLLYGACEPMRDLFRTLDRLSRSTAPVMILGESGSGKELVATTLHRLSARNEQPFIAINCGAIPETLIESELFGHERGS